MIEKPATIALLISLFIFATYSANAAFTVDQIKAVAKKCNATDDDLELAVKYEVPNTNTGKCLMTCILKEVQTLTDKGVYEEKVALEAFKLYWPELDAKSLDNIAKECQATVQGQEELAKSDPCEYGYKVALCVNKYFKSSGAIPSSTQKTD